MFELKRFFARRKPPVDGRAGAAVADDTIRVVAITESAADGRTLRAIGTDAGWAVTVVPTAGAAAAVLDGQPPQIVICDRDLPDENWRDVMARFAPLPQVACVLLASTVSDEYLWDEVIQFRGYDVVVKPFDADQLRRTVKFAWSWRRWSTGADEPAVQGAPVNRKRR